MLLKACACARAFLFARICRYLIKLSLATPRGSDYNETDYNFVFIRKDKNIMISKIKEKLLWFMDLFRGHMILQYLFMASFTSLVIEILNHRSLVEGLLYPLRHPIPFGLNVGIILLVLSVSILFRHRFFACIVLMVVPIGLAIANFVLVGMRVIPLEFVDFSILKTGIGIIGIYMSVWQLIGLGIVFLLGFTGLGVLWFKLPKSSASFRTKVASLLAALAFFNVWAVAAEVTDTIPDDVGNVAEAYENYGFVYCFSMTIFDKGVEKPENYSKETVEAVLAKTTQENEMNGTPNVLFLQLESFFDINAMTNIELSEDPVPTFRRLKEDYTSGFLTVPSIGAGTANTEFEIITQMNLDYFGTGEYPFQTVLTDHTCESSASVLADLGYSTHMFHNHTGAFYCRNVVYPNLGVKSFTSLEYMQDVERNPQGFAKDAILVDEIESALQSTTTPDYIYTISVQGHGKYPTSPVDDTQTITVKGLPTDEQTSEYEYYVNQIHEMDLFVADLIAMLEERGEDTILVMYGDHLPSLGIAEENLTAGNLYQTEYVIWDNMGLAENDRDLHSYQLAAHAFEQIGLHSGTMTGVHQTMQNDPGYQETLRLLQYDLLYGGHYANGGKALPGAKQQFGIRPVTIMGLNVQDSDIVVHGLRFTEWSQVYVNGKKVDTTYLSSTDLLIPGNAALPGDIITVVQVCEDTTVLGSSAPYEY